ncbi:MAG TPA: secretin N-terminal domain-containing protein, partial [Thermoguttaceae bacterium]|nr:secretin N-terminal domain-containing protein [Thermoguttaceae bacterium]
VDSQNARQEGIFRIRYSKADTIAQTVKSLYRDLLSPNDKAFDGKKREQTNNPYVYYRSFGGGKGDEEKLERAPKFKGLLSIGVDDQSNSLLVSAPAYLYQHVAEMIVKLDEAAKPVVSTIDVVRFDDSIDTAELQKALARIAGESSSAPRRSRPENNRSRTTPPNRP